MTDESKTPIVLGPRLVNLGRGSQHRPNEVSRFVDRLQVASPSLQDLGFLQSRYPSITLPACESNVSLSKKRYRLAKLPELPEEFALQTSRHRLDYMAIT